MADPVATEIKVRSKSRLLEVCFADGSRFELPFEYLRVHSPSAEVKGHGPGQEVLVLGKENVGVRAVEPIGQYAVKIVFDDGHDTGLFTCLSRAMSPGSSEPGKLSSMESKSVL